ncbi:MAG: methylenetetrahydrofolate--tRNA-(uracil(54)-C(5))-methyltransferase (FADH(2)-oxidizing) TrmFO [Acidobacteria bacterium]|nr:methylenetetrahydrofolate--tRNA-(uracil(54)-C(5))-methyltransferase (FADH(2)-oxidizing) TrmFO [Acidobacteriota bacterium]
MIRIVGGGLAGCEAAWQAAARGVPVTLHEMRPVRATAVHKTDRLAELVCSNSFRGAKLENAVGLLKEEMRRLDSLIMRVAGETSVPAGGALAVDRERFAAGVTGAIERNPRITVVREEVSRIPATGGPAAPVILATGPLTSAALSAEIAALVGQDHLYFYDAISPIVLAESIDRSKVFRGSRWDQATDGDYLNCPLDAEEYRALHEALVTAELTDVHDFDRARFFEGCLPVEVMARRGLDTLRFGPLKPVGLTDPASGRRPHAVVQLRQDNLAAEHYSLVGFQTQIKWGEQRRVLRMIPGLEQGEFVRYGMIHRNTYINAPTVLRETWQTRSDPGLLIAGQISGVEGYVESAASGLMAGVNAAALVQGRPLIAPPRTTAMGALAHYVSHANPSDYQPMNVAFGLLPSLERPPRNRRERRQALAERALNDLAAWSGALGLHDERATAVLS